jgi:RNA polymerase sigma-70 factor, ECF subfamily
MTACQTYDLVAAAKQGERAAFDALVARYRHGIWALCLDRVGNFDLAEDLTQETILRAYAALPELRADAAFGPWLRQIAVNCCRIWLRRPLPQTEELAEATLLQMTEDTHQQAMRREAARQVRQSLAELPERNRIALVMHALRGDSYREIADFLGVPESTVLGRIHRARAAVRRLLLERLDEDITTYRQEATDHERSDQAD